jgi:F-type H+-transporting ATPase subunit b
VRSHWKIGPWFVGVLGVALLALSAGGALASGGGHEAGGGELLKDFIGRSVNFVLLVGLLGYFLRKPLAEGLAGRRDKVTETLRHARQAREEAEGRAAILARQLAESEERIAALVERMKQENEQERDKLLEKARHTADSIRREAEAGAAREIERARRELRAEAVSLAIDLAEQRLKEGLQAADQERLVEQYLKQVGENQ